MASAPTCPACGSDDLGRGRTRTAWQQFLRDATPLRRYRCHACGAEGWTFRHLPRSQHPAEQQRGRLGVGLAGRPIEDRDVDARWRGTARALVMVAAALLLGAAAADRLVSCQGQRSSIAGP
jgi:hypothetical protein